MIRLTLVAAAQAIPLFRWLNPSKYACLWPGQMTTPPAFERLEGTWLVSHSSYGTDRFGCLRQQFRMDDDGDPTTFDIDVSWKAFQATLTPFDKGAFA